MQAAARDVPAAGACACGGDTKRRVSSLPSLRPVTTEWLRGVRSSKSERCTRRTTLHGARRHLSRGCGRESRWTPGRRASRQQRSATWLQVCPSWVRHRWPFPRRGYRRQHPLLPHTARPGSEEEGGGGGGGGADRAGGEGGCGGGPAAEGAREGPG